MNFKHPATSRPEQKPNSNLIKQCRLKKTTFFQAKSINTHLIVILVIFLGLSAEASTISRGNSGTNRGENSRWANPCDYATNPSTLSIKYDSSLPDKVSRKAKNTCEDAKMYSSEIASLLSFDSFSAMVQYIFPKSDDEWLRQLPWYIPEMLPHEKTYGKSVNDKYLTGLMENIDEILPAMMKTLKFLAVVLWKITEWTTLEEIEHPTGALLWKNLEKTSGNVFGTLCEFYVLMHARHLYIPEVLDSDILLVDSLSDNGQISHIVSVYHSTLNYLEYLEQVFEKMESCSRLLSPCRLKAVIPLPPPASGSRSGENLVWDNPCNVSKPLLPRRAPHKQSLAGRIARKANLTYIHTKQYINEIASMKSLNNFDELVTYLSDDSRVVKKTPWNSLQVMLERKKYRKIVDDEYLTVWMRNIDQYLPTMMKNLKLLAATVWKITKWPFLVQPGYREDHLRECLILTSKNLLVLLCNFYKLMRARHLNIPELLDSDIPTKDTLSSVTERVNHINSVYLATLDYLQYTHQVFEKMKKSV